ncbi:hypothetical protein Fuma_02883 [Fuerstiella marisgermanici]|uniref:Uncharacterized protein n=1 Tax=Fuerstiella marisgermanici TaxID=1891926 RepID=A0A1P8WGR3_9PLAN|nr:hypothetical protein Fuma_02883 [Fuerstiella marisgermanici]
MKKWQLCQFRSLLREHLFSEELAAFGPISMCFRWLQRSCRERPDSQKSATILLCDTPLFSNR